MPQGEPTHALRFAIQLAEAEGYAECAAGLRTVLAHLERAQWRPIEEAPKDKDWLLVGAEGHTPADSWCEPAFWHDGSRNYWERAGWYALEDRGNILTAKPLTGTTHYMLPPSPETPR